MNNPTRRFSAGAALLLLGLSLILAVNLTASPIARATPGVLYAAPAAQGMGNCSDWDNACTLQTALAQAQSGDEIWVQAGVHYPTTDPNDRTATFALRNGVALYGGFAGTETSRDARDWQTHKTILSGDIDQNDITDPNGVVTTTAHIAGTNAYHVVTGSGTDSSAVLDGFFITAGQANGDWPNDSGGGITNSGGSPTLTNVTFSGNSATYHGGGMYNELSSNPTLTDVTFSGNSASSGGGMSNTSSSNPALISATFSGNSANHGGGMYNAASNPTLTNVTFSGNSATDYGGGMCNYESGSTLTNVTFSSNSASFGGGILNLVSIVTLTNVTFSGNSAAIGGGMYNDESSPTLTNVIFSGNLATYYGGGIFNMASSNPTLTNVTLSGNSAEAGGGMTNYSSRPMLNNVIIWANTASTGSGIYYNYGGTSFITYSDIQGCGSSGAGWNGACGTDGGGNIDADPRFVDAAGGNLRLIAGSPCVDAGDNTAVPAGIATDLDGNPRFVDIADVPDTGRGTPPIVDMGAYETQVGHLIFLPLVVRN